MSSVQVQTGRDRRLVWKIGLVVWAAVSLAASWYAVATLSGLLFGFSSLQYLPETVTAAVVGTSIYLGYGENSIPRIASYLAGMVLVTTLFLWVVHMFVSFFLVSVVGSISATIATLVTTGLATAALCFVAVLVADRGRSTNWALSLRMVIASLGLAICLLIFFTLLWPIVLFASGIVFQHDAVPDSRRIVLIVTPVLTGLFMLAIGYAEYNQITAVEERTDAEVLTRADEPELHDRVTRLAAQLDIPKPTIAVSESRIPEAFVVGFRPSNTHLVVSRGTLERVTDDELDAVLAHELAHIANRDSMVMTAVSAPLVVANGILTAVTIDRDDSEDSESADDDTQDEDDDSVWADDGDSLTKEQLYGEDGEWRMTGAAPADQTETSEQQTADDGDGGFGDKVMKVIGAVMALPYVAIPVIVWFLLRTVTRFIWGVSRIIVCVLSRTRERVADDVAVAATGSPGALASALRTLDDEIAKTPSQDLREVSGVSSLSILPLDSGVVGDSQARHSSTGRLKRRLYQTHPDTVDRLQRLEALERAAEQDE